MKTETIKDGEKILVVILKSDAFPQGLTFHTSEKDFIQLSTWNYDKGKKTIPHLHKKAKREANRTQEVIFVKNGEIKMEIYSDEGKFLKAKKLEKGDIAIIFSGGHGYEILKPKTQIIEVKNGPYLGLKKDKKVINVC